MQFFTFLYHIKMNMFGFKTDSRNFGAKSVSQLIISVIFV